MSTRTAERVDDWDTVPFGGGYGGLRDLSSQEFSGVVTAGPTRLFMIRGTVVGVLDGSIDDFEDAGGSAREAPHPALPLLAVMQERSDEVRAKYYTEDTPISDVDRTLEDGSFTGYVELSENVLSGDYYQVYHQGRSMSVAYVGSSERLITDDEAFEQADDEVGIYEVRPVEIDAVDVPEPANDAADFSETGPAATGATSSDESNDSSPTDAGADARTATGDEPPETDSADAGSAMDDQGGPTGRTGSDPTADPTETPSTTGTDTGTPPTDADTETPPTGADTGTSSADSDAGTPSAGSDTGTPSADEGTDVRSDRAGHSPTDSHVDASSRPDTGERSASQEPPSTGRRSSTDRRSSSGAERSADTPATDAVDPSDSRHSAGDHAAGTERSGSDGPRRTDAVTGGENGDRGTPSPSGTAGDLEVRSIPSLDPSRSRAASKASSTSQSSGRGSNSPRPSQSQQPAQRQQSPAQSADRADGQRAADDSSRQPSQGQSRQEPDQPPRTATDQSSTDQGTDRQTAPSGGDGSDPESELAAREQELRDVRTDLERVEAERDELERTSAELEAERDRLQAELEESRAEVERLTERLEELAEDGTSGAETRLSSAEAIDDTNLFVRYRSKGDATLESAHAGNADRAAVAENVRLEYHTQFDADAAAVGDEPFDDFLTDTIQYRFVDWLIGSLLYEIRDTGNADGMAALYDALPKIDRAELNGQVSVSYVEDGEEHRSQERFDVVVRDRMGNPLVVANINDSRDPATDAMMTDLVKRAERVGESSEALAGAFLVTESFFEPEALETADGATSSGLFSRDKRKSFVNLSRKDGYHLCLLEARNREFHLAVPEL